MGGRILTWLFYGTVKQQARRFSWMPQTARRMILRMQELDEANRADLRRMSVFSYGIIPTSQRTPGQTTNAEISGPEMASLIKRVRVFGLALEPHPACDLFRRPSGFERSSMAAFSSG